MTAHQREPLRVLSVDPTSRGFGFAVLEGPGKLVDWGVHEQGGRGKDAALQKVADLMQQYEPDVVVVEDYDSRSSRRRPRARATIHSIVKLANANGTAATLVPISTVHELFGGHGLATKEHVAAMIAEHFTGLSLRLPPKRKPWMSEAESMAIFDAVAFALGYYFLHRES